MTNRTRREWLAAGACTALAAWSPTAVRAAMGPDDKFDLLVRNANVLDPSQNLKGTRDIGIRYGQIESIAASIAPERAARVLDAAGRLVTPGLIDLHAHTFPYGSAIGIPADELVPYQCTTTVVSAGDAGANNIAAFRRLAMAQSRTRQFAFVHIAVAGLAGFPVPELFNIDYAQVDAAARAVAENADIVLGVKVRMSENVVARHGLEPLKRAIAACEKSGVPAKVMCHIGGVQTRELMSQILDMLRPGDVLVIWKLDRLGRSLRHLVELASVLLAQEVGLKSLNDPLDTTTSQGRLVFNLFASLAEFERDLIRERTQAGLIAARARGRLGGRPKGLPPEAEKTACAAETLYRERRLSVREIAADVGLKNQASLYHHFRNKRALYEAVLARGVEALVEMVAGSVVQGADGGNAIDAVETSLDRVVDYLVEHPHLPRLPFAAVRQGLRAPLRRALREPAVARPRRAPCTRPRQPRRRGMHADSLRGTLGPRSATAPCAAGAVDDEARASVQPDP